MRDTQCVFRLAGIPCSVKSRRRRNQPVGLSGLRSMIAQAGQAFRRARLRYTIRPGCTSGDASEVLGAPLVHLRVTLLYCVAFYFLIMLHASMHELVHHFTGAAICGEWGTKSFNLFRLACGADTAWLATDATPWSRMFTTAWFATYAGPIYSYAMMWLGALWIARGDSTWWKHLGFSTIFAQLPLQRISGPLFGWNDEWFATRHIFGADELNRWITLLVLIAICLPPLVVAYRSIANRWRWAWFAFYFALFPALLFAPALIGLEYLMVGRQVLAQPFFGIGLLFILNEIITVIGWVLTQKYIDPAFTRHQAPRAA